MNGYAFKSGSQYQLGIRKLSEKTKYVKSKIITSLRRNVFLSKSEAKLRSMIKSGEIVIIPAGFRCYTKSRIFTNLNFSQRSMPFDNGFFPPCAIASVLRNPKINLKYNDNHLTHSVCIKYENYSDPISGNGIKFQKSSYEEIDSLAMSRDMRGINKYLDDTFGYYTLDIEHNFVLAHYNWHKFSDRTEVHDHSINLEKINRTLNKRIRIMLERCSIANYIFFIVGEFQDYQYMMIDNQSMDLHCFDELVNTAESLFNAQCVVSKIDDVDSAEKLLAMIN